MIGKTISHYRIIDRIGQGGMGVVYKAEDTRLHRVVALKFLPSHLTGATQEMTRFVQEARAAAALDHPNICTIFEIDVNAEQPFISMAYVEGKNLKEIAAAGPMKLDDALRYATQVARGLEEAHAKGVVHRDVKSANVVVSEKGHAIVMDFGLAKLQGQTKLTQSGTTVGTVSYMSPEQAQGEEVDGRSDIWSLGVMLYRMIAGRYPFEGEHQSAVLYSIMNKPHEPLTALRTGVPMELERIVDKALRKDPGERYQSASDLIVDLKAARNRLGEPASDSAVTGRPPAATPRRRYWLVAAASVLVVAAGLFLWQQFSGGRGSSPAGRDAADDARVSIAVLPLDNMSADESQEYIADGMTEALIAELAQIHALRVISRTSVMRFKKTTQSIPEVAKVLGVNTIIEGSVVQAGGRVRVTAQLIDAKTDEHLWAQSYERDLSDVLALQSEVARAIAAEVEVELTPDESVRLASSSAVDPRAYDLYMRGRYHWNRRSEPDLERALEFFQQVVDIQPDWALGYSALAQTNLVMASWAARPAEELYPRAQEWADKALELDPALGSAWACLAGVAAEWNWDWDKAEEYFLKAIDLEPNNAGSHQWYAEFLAAQGRFDEALREIDTARRLDPLALVNGVVKTWICSAVGDFDQAIATGEHLVEMDSTFMGVYTVLGDAYRYAGDYDRAVSAYATYFSTVVPGADQVIRDAHASGGIDSVVRAILNGEIQARRTTYVSPANIGFHYAAVGEADSAFAWLEKAVDERAYPITAMAVNPDCRPVHTDPRFDILLERLGLEHVTPFEAKR